MVPKNSDNYYPILLFTKKIYNNFMSFNYTYIK